MERGFVRLRLCCSNRIDMDEIVLGGGSDEVNASFDSLFWWREF